MAGAISTRLDEDVEQATAAAARAADRAGVTVALVDSARAAHAAAAVWAAVWPGTSPPVAPEMAWAIAHSGNYVGIAIAGGEVVGAALGFGGVDDDGPVLHSHIAGVRPGRDARGVGRALKLHQRAWTLRHGIDRICWTFDPLVARNAYFNVSLLGADVVAYVVDFYGPMTDGINGNDETDRALIRWSLRSARVAAAADSSPDVEGPSGPPILDVPVVLAPDREGWPCPQPVGDVAPVAIDLPPDIVAVRRRDPTQAAAWRTALREVLGDALDAGWVVRSVTRGGRYLLTRP